MTPLPMDVLALSGWIFAGLWSLLMAWKVSPQRARTLILADLGDPESEGAKAVRAAIIEPCIKGLADTVHERLKQAGFGAMAARSREERQLMDAVEKSVKDRAKEWLDGPLTVIETFAPEVGENIRNLAEKNPEMASRAVVRVLKFAESRGLVTLEEQGGN